MQAMAVICVFGQALQQRIHPRTCCAEPGSERVPFMRQYTKLLVQQGIGALQFLVTEQKALYPFGDLVDLGLVRHGCTDCRVCGLLGRRIWLVGARSVVHTLQFNGKQEGVKAIRNGSTRSAGAATFNLRCPRNGKTDECPAGLFLQAIQLSSFATEYP